MATRLKSVKKSKLNIPEIPQSLISTIKDYLYSMDDAHFNIVKNELKPYVEKFVDSINGFYKINNAAKRDYVVIKSKIENGTYPQSDLQEMFEALPELSYTIAYRKLLNKKISNNTIDPFMIYIMILLADDKRDQIIDIVYNNAINAIYDALHCEFTKYPDSDDVVDLLDSFFRFPDDVKYYINIYNENKTNINRETLLETVESFYQSLVNYIIPLEEKYNQNNINAFKEYCEKSPEDWVEKFKVIIGIRNRLLNTFKNNIFKNLDKPNFLIKYDGNENDVKLITSEIVASIVYEKTDSIVKLFTDAFMDAIDNKEKIDNTDILKYGSYENFKTSLESFLKEETPTNAEILKDSLDEYYQEMYDNYITLNEYIRIDPFKEIDEKFEQVFANNGVEEGDDKAYEEVYKVSLFQIGKKMSMYGDFIIKYDEIIDFDSYLLSACETEEDAKASEAYLVRLIALSEKLNMYAEGYNDVVDAMTSGTLAGITAALINKYNRKILS